MPQLTFILTLAVYVALNAGQYVYSWLFYKLYWLTYHQVLEIWWNLVFSLG